MKRILAVLLALTLVFALAACGEKPAPAPASQPPAATQPPAPETQPPVEPTVPPTEPPAENLSDWQKSKTGKFYGKFGDEMYMEYETEAGGMLMTVISATSGGKTYSESKVDGETMGVSILDGEYMYVIDHASKMVIKMSLQLNSQEIMDTMLTEGDVDPSSMVTGTREVDGKTYDTEEWSVEGATSILCFDGDDLVYMIGEYEGIESMMRIITVSDKVDKSLFEIPSDYQEISY